LLIKPVQDIVTRHKLNASVHVVVTDPFTAHPMWFMQPGVQYIVFSQSLKDSCVQAGINEQLIKVFPFVINEKFTRGFTDFEKSCAKIKLGFSLHKKVVLIMGGGDGMPRGRDIVKNLTACNIDAEIAIVCGKNKRLFDKCHELKIKHKLVNLKIYGFVDFVHTLIGISDVVITKCGASTFMEIITMGKVPVINNFIWEQEKGNMEYVCHNNMGIYEKNTRRLPRVLQSVLTDEKLYETYRQNITRLLPVNGTRLVSEYLLDIQH
jgi:processive 1,2-diacylglycerol beta-glucosyltransferase/1,2-diacylglycerol 3-beta-galactosyltransferase